MRRLGPLAILLLLIGCVSYSPWKLTSNSTIVTREIAVANEQILRYKCNQIHLPNSATLNGCIFRLPDFSIIFYRTDRTEWQIQCTLRHERAHAAGWTHEEAYVNDCGPDEFKE